MYNLVINKSDDNNYTYVRRWVTGDEHLSDLKVDIVQNEDAFIIDLNEAVNLFSKIKLEGISCYYNII